jgi:ABC-type transport system involved in multi-copper enzyme maturation permease subunit
MTLAIAWNTWRECTRRPFTYVSVLTLIALALSSSLLGLFVFGSGAPELANLAISTVLLAALVTAGFLGTALVRSDLERGTFLLLMSQPVGLASYLWGRFLGLLAVTVLACGLTAAGVMAAVGASGAALYAGCARVLLAAPVLSAAALAFSSITGRIFAPVLLLALFVAGDLAADGPFGRILPAFGLFGLDASRSPPLGWLALYSGLHSVVFLVITYLRLTLKTPIRTES